MKQNLMGRLHSCSRLVNRGKTLAIFFLLSIYISVPVFAQNYELNLNYTNVPLKNILDKIASETSLSIVYNTKDVDPGRLVTINANNENISSVLDRLLSDTDINYKIVDSHLILSSKKAKDTNNQAKKITVKGVVKDASGEPLIGVSILLQGTSSGTISDFDGNFTLMAPENATLKVSYVGYVTKFVKATATNLEVVLQEDTKVLDEVVVTALGIKRETKSLTYNVQELKAADISTVKDANLVNSLAGKVAGVTINQSASGVGGSSRVVMRGTKSLFGDNNALYVVDGIPLIPMKTEQTTSYFESPDGGDSDGISSLNPDDIESMSVLSGAAASTLYGTMGANGVILITTKKGKEGKLKVNYSNDTQFMTPFVMPKFQNTYGSEKGSYESWGDKLEQPSNYDPADFFQTGYSEINSLSVSAGNDVNQTYFSAASTNARGIMPSNTYNKYNFKLRNTTQLIKDKLTLDLSAAYIVSDNNNMLAQGQYHNPLIPLYLFPRGDDMTKYQAYERHNSERNFPTQFWPYGNQGLAMENPYWIVNRENYGNNKNRYMFTGNVNWKVDKNINVTSRLRVDNTNDTYERKISASSSKLFASDNGNYLNQKTDYNNVYGDVIANFDYKFTDFGINTNLGASFTNQKLKRMGYEGHLLTVPNLFTFSNINRNGADTRPLQSSYHENNQAVFATTQLSYKSWMFLDLTGRNDWYSSLAYTNNENKGFFYYSVGLSGVLTEMFDLSKYNVSFMKLRASYSEVGNAPQRFVTNTTYPIVGSKLQTLPNVPATFLKPERTHSYELGANIRMFEDLINLDLTYYNTNTFNQFFTFTMPPSSGYRNFYINGGKVNNWGIEANLGIKKTFGDLSWRSNLTFTMNRNEIKELLPEDAVNPITHDPINKTEIEPFAPQGSYKMILKKGGTMGDIYVSGLVRDEHGNIKVDINTNTIQADPRTWYKVGSSAPRFNWGWNNSFSYKGFSLGVLLSARVGGVGVSATQALMDRFGVSQATADARDNGGKVVNNGRIPASNYYSVVGGGNTGVLSQYVYSMTNIRLRELNIGYSLPKSWFNNAINKCTLSLIGKNLFMLYNKAPFDPEITASTSTYYQGFDYFMQPSLRSLGFSVKIEY